MTIEMSLWGNIPTWITALVGCAMFFYHATLFRQTSRDRVRDQAAKVTVQAIGDVAYVRNDSDLPIFEMYLVMERGPEDPPEYVAFSLPWCKVVNSRAKCAIDVLVPHEDFTAGMPPGLPDGSRIVALEFTDAHGRNWRRDILGRLEKTPRYREQKFVTNGPTLSLPAAAPVFPKGSDEVVEGASAHPQVGGVAGLIPSQRSSEETLQPATPARPAPEAETEGRGSTPRPGTFRGRWVTDPRRR
ncbi:hypothetical protein ACWDTQ_31070 [Streptomyces cellulosae]